MEPFILAFIVVVICGVVLWLVPMDSRAKSIGIAVIAIGVILYLLNAYGVFHRV